MTGLQHAAPALSVRSARLARTRRLSPVVPHSSTRVFVWPHAPKSLARAVCVFVQPEHFSVEDNELFFRWKRGTSSFRIAGGGIHGLEVAQSVGLHGPFQSCAGSGRSGDTKVSEYLQSKAVANGFLDGRRAYSCGKTPFLKGILPRHSRFQGPAGQVGAAVDCYLPSLTRRSFRISPLYLNH